MHSRAPVLVSQVINGPVVVLVGGRLGSQRPGPQPSRRVSEPVLNPLAA